MSRAAAVVVAADARSSSSPPKRRHPAADSIRGRLALPHPGSLAAVVAFGAFVAFVVFGAFMCGVRTAHAQPAGQARVAHLEQALAQLKTAAEPYALDRELYDAVRLRCKAATTTACMIGVARELCGNRGCLAAADVLITNQHAERDLLDEPTRMRLVRGSVDYHAAVLVELRGRYALLAAELVLAWQPREPLGSQIDRLCVERDRVARRCVADQPACLGTIAYQRCAAGLVWFVSTREVRE